MKIDITLKVTPQMISDAQGNEKMALAGHVGTHFDVMNKEFPLDYTEREGIVFDVSHVTDRDITLDDIDMDKVKKDMFVAFYSGYGEKVHYGEKAYFTEHPQLSYELLEALLKKDISIIGLDFGGVRRGAEHVPMDQRCADQGIFVIENLCNLDKILDHDSQFKAHTYPVNFTNTTGLVCRVVAEVA